MQTLSVIITAYKQNDITAVHVRECMNSSVVPDEIIVINDGGHEDLREKLLALERNTKIIYAYINQDIAWNYTGARNLGVWLSSGDFLSMEDNDNIPSTDCYKQALAYFEEHSEVNRVFYGRRPMISTKMALSQTAEEWLSSYNSAEKIGTRPRHNDTQMIRRLVYLKMKGCDERFAGKYAWACSDFRRRFQRAGLVEEKDGEFVDHAVSNHFFTVFDGETITCKCEVKNFDGANSFCLTCKKPIWRKSYTNYNMARESDGHVQSPKGMLNFTYKYEIL